MNARSRYAALLAFLLVGASEWPARGLAAVRGNPYLVQAKALYETLEFERCVAMLGKASHWNSTPAEVVEGELYRGLCEVNLNHVETAQRAFARALEVDPAARLPPGTSPKVRALFAEVARGEARNTPPPPPPAQSDRPVIPPAGKADLRPEVPATPPVQIQVEPESGRSANHHVPVAPIVLGGLAVGAVVAGVIFGFQSQANVSSAGIARYDAEMVAFNRQATQNALVANLCFGGAVASGLSAGLLLLLGK